MKKFELMEINGDALREALASRKIKITKLGEMLYKSNGYGSEIVRRGSINKGDFALMKFIFEQKGIGFTEKELDAIEMKPEITHNFTFGYITKTDDNGKEVVICKLFEDGKEVAMGFGTIRVNTRLEYASAVAWATRCMWKQVESQEERKGGI